MDYNILMAAFVISELPRELDFNTSLTAKGVASIKPVVGPNLGPGSYNA
jgi:hypothetical protein